MDLVLSLILDNTNSLQVFDKICYHNLLLTNKECYKNKNIQNEIFKYYIYYLYKLFDNNISFIVFSKLSEHYDNVQYTSTEEIRIIEMINKNEKVKKAFSNLLISEYKELVYNSIFDPYHDTFYDKLIEYERFLAENYSNNDIIDHKYDTTYLLKNKKYYLYYEMIEKHGKNILNAWEHM